MALIDRLRSIVEPLCADLSVELYDIDLNGGVFKVTIDKPGGVDLTDIAELTRQVSRAMDEHDPITSRYTLEVTSPGLERVLRTSAHFLRAVGDTVKVKLLVRSNGDRRLEGIVVSADDHEVVLRVGDADRRLAYDDIERARTVFQWGPTPRPAGPKKQAGERAEPHGADHAPAQPKQAQQKQKAAGSPAASQAADPAASTERSASSDAAKVVNA
jgi:ribosome maturation factor RimP